MNNFAGSYAEFSSVDNVNVNNNIGNVHFTVDELLDFSREDETMTDTFFNSLAGNSNDSSIVKGVDSCNSSISGGGDGQFNGNISCRSFTDSQFSAAELCIPVKRFKFCMQFLEMCVLDFSFPFLLRRRHKYASTEFAWDFSYLIMFVIYAKFGKCKLT